MTPSTPDLIARMRALINEGKSTRETISGLLAWTAGLVAVVRDAADALTALAQENATWKEMYRAEIAVNARTEAQLTAKDARLQALTEALTEAVRPDVRDDQGRGEPDRRTWPEGS